MNNDLISRSALKKACSEMVRGSNNSDFIPCPTWNNAMELIDNAPTIDISDLEEYEDMANALNIASELLHKKIPQGEWECVRIGNTNFITCSHCKEQFETENTLELWQDEYKFCHRCGAKMGGEKE